MKPTARILLAFAGLTAMTVAAPLAAQTNDRPPPPNDPGARLFGISEAGSSLLNTAFLPLGILNGTAGGGSSSGGTRSGTSSPHAGSSCGYYLPFSFLGFGHRPCADGSRGPGTGGARFHGPIPNGATTRLAGPTYGLGTLSGSERTAFVPGSSTEFYDGCNLLNFPLGILGKRNCGNRPGATAVTPQVGGPRPLTPGSPLRGGPGEPSLEIVR